MNSKHTILKCFAVAAVFASQASALFATEQLADKVRFGRRIFATHQSPMNELWHMGEGEPPKGKTRPPKFDFESTANWKGYTATWEIRDSQLFLDQITGSIDGRKLKNEAILPGERFPVDATWFSGKIQIAVGDYVEERQEFEAIIEFDIQKGKVKSMAFYPSGRLNMSLNGLGK